MSAELNAEELVSKAVRPLFVRLLNDVHDSKKHPESANSCFLCASQKPPFDEALIRAMQTVQSSIDDLTAENARLRASLNNACDWLKRLQEEYDPTDTEDGIASIGRLREGKGNE